MNKHLETIIDARWRVGDDAHHVIDNGDVLVCQTDTEYHAALIAATPDLLAACDDAVQALMLLPPDCLDEVSGQPSRDELINNIFGAIARARLE